MSTQKNWKFGDKVNVTLTGVVVNTIGNIIFVRFKDIDFDGSDIWRSSLRLEMDEPNYVSIKRVED